MPLWRWRYWGWQAATVTNAAWADIALAPLPLLLLQCWHYCGTGIVADVDLAQFWHCCCCSAGILAAIALTPLPWSLLRRWRPHGTGINWDVALAPLEHCCHHGTGVLADVALALLPLLPSQCWCHCRRCPGAAWTLLLLWCWRPCRCRPGTVAIVVIAALPSLQRWHHCGCCLGPAWASLLSRRWRPCRGRPGTVAIVAVTTLASSRRWHHRGCHPGIAWTLLLSRHWQHGGRCPGAVANIAVEALALLKSSRWRHCQCSLGTITVVVLALSSLSCRHYPLGGIALAMWTSVPFIEGGASGGLCSNLKLPSSLAWYPLYPSGHALPEPPLSSSLVSCSSWHSLFMAPSPSFGLLHLGGPSGQHLGWVSGAMPATPNSITAVWARPHH